jgi:cytochrome c553
MKPKVLWSLLVSVLSVAWVGPAAYAAGDREEGKKKFYSCAGCHGIEGYSNAYPMYQVPRIGGQHADYVVSALKSYQSGARKHVSMHGNAISLSDDDLQDIAAYVSGFRSISVDLAVKGNAQAGEVKAKECAGCHGQDGNTEPESGNPRLAGQYENYLVKALRDYKSGARKNAIMSGIAGSLSEQDMDNLAAFYARQKKGLIVVND